MWCAWRNSDDNRPDASAQEASISITLTFLIVGADAPPSASVVWSLREEVLRTALRPDARQRGAASLVVST